MHESPSHRQLLLAVLTSTAAAALISWMSGRVETGSRLAQILIPTALVLVTTSVLALRWAVASRRAHQERLAVLRRATNASALREAVMDAAPVGFAFFDRELRYVHVNTALAAMNGLPAANHLGHHVAEVMPELGRLLAPRLQQALETDTPIQDPCLQVETPAAPGEPRFWFSSYSRVRGTGGEVLGVIAALSELTERMRAERSLQEQEDRVDVLTRSLPDYLWGGKLRGGVLRDFYCTPVVERTTGYPVSAFAQPGPDGGPPPLWAEMVHPEDRARYRACIERLAPGAEVELEHRIICSDGRVRWVRSRAAASALDSEQELHVGCVVTDVTDRRLADDLRQRLHTSFRRSAQEWRRTFDAVSSPLLVLSADGVIQRLNAASITLFDGLDPTGQPLSTTPPTALRSSTLLLLEVLRRTHGSASREVTDPPTGRAWEVSGAWVEDGDDSRIIFVATEVTRLMELQARLRRHETMAAMGAIVAGVAHEVRNPLFSISAVVDAVEATFGTRAELQPYLEVLRGEVKRLNHLTQELFEYGRPARGEWVEGPVRPVVEEALDACALAAEQAGVAVVPEVSTELPPVRMDSRRLFHVFRNVVENAVQHSPSGTRVRVATEAVQENGRDWVRCTVHDTGPGFRDDDLPHVFEPFFSKRRGGTGLGLSIVQRILEEHQGIIRLRNAESGGAEVTLLLPAVSSPPATQSVDSMAS
ncbi:PAS domain-containing protein [Pyxidicoccus parkwayensis]|uniref:histidine kinase n=1 Tax=Pyxidicoccus parkwayensis TaxID=2813578 RepID=A0ABX7P4M9_9BACT|nr:PAS domain-containing protein [Pyxidicoccus parkwaysis]QSQ25447.1 PAS domain-containing protein [Pyxidicoccus parkwaysis]